MEPLSNITGLILAGGAGRRVDNRDKGLILLQSKPLIAHVCDRLKPQVGSLIISCNRNIARYKNFAVQTVGDQRQEYQGPLAGLEAAAPYIKSGFLIVVGCDTPNLPYDLVGRLIQPLLTLAKDGPDISYVHDGEREQYLCAALRRESLFSLTPYLDGGGRAVRGWYETQNTTSVDFSDQRSSFKNYNKMV
jgi:molybdopterin-guanine dinucleotide biosynthesis protein A